MPTRSFGGHYLSTAFSLVHAAAAAYATDPTTADGFELFGFDSIDVFGNAGSANGDSSRGFVASREDAIVLAFRGTIFENIGDWIINLNFQQVEDNGALVHQGFFEALSDVWSSIETLLRKRTNEKRRTIWITGHSLGGALATLATRWVAEWRIAPVETFSFGQPRVGNGEMVRQIRTPFYRFAYHADPVPLAPFSLPRQLDYKHAGMPEILYADGSVLETAANPLTGILLTALSTTWFVGNIFDNGIDRFVQQRIGDHFIANYVAKLELAVNRLRKLPS